MPSSSTTSSAERPRGEAWLTAFGFERDGGNDRRAFATAAALALALAALPLLLLARFDTDRALPLAFLPAVWFAARSGARVSRLEGWLVTWAVAAMLLATVRSEHVARATVMAAAVLWTMAGAWAARSIAGSVAATRLVLAGIVTGAVIGVVLVRLGVAAERMFFPTYWSARLFGGHQFAGCVAALALLVLAPPRQRLTQVLTLMAALVTFVGLAWSGSRAPALGLAVALLAWWWRGTSIERKRLMLAVPILAAAGLAFSYPLGSPYPQLGWWHALERTVAATGVEAVTSERSRFWSAVWEEIAHAPWIGHGADAYLYIHPTQNGNQPHNVVLQWWLEYGVLGALPLALLVACAFRGLGRRREAENATPSFRGWAAASAVGIAAYACFDGVFYHMIVFMPVAGILGLALHATPAAPEKSAPACLAPLSRIGLAFALGFLVLHNWMYRAALRPEVSPDSAVAQWVRVFPSTTDGVIHWIQRWHKTDPGLALEWTRWGQTTATNQGPFHVFAAQIYIWEKDFKKAEAEMLRCLEKVHHLERADVLQVIATVRQLAAEQEAKAQSRQPAAGG